MKPYIAILIDSFWEAVGNKVLWALLLGWSFILAGLFPFGYVSESSYRLSSFDIQSKSRLVEKLARGVKGQGPQDIQKVAGLLKPDFATRLKEISDKSASEQINERELAKALSEVVASSELYSEEVFPTAKRRPRLEGLIEQVPQGLAKAEQEQLNRELLQLVFPLELSQPRGEQLWIGYAGFKIGEPLPVSRRQINQFLEPIFLTLIIKLGLGIVAIFVALVVTSPIIPETFRSSSLHLLLSKPISRVGLFLWKFFGATIFVLVNITFVLVGLYFIAGIRFEIWNNGLLGCIPLLLFVFMIFYSVSALAGLLWGNAIVCVVSCIVFWVFCFGLGFIRDVMRAPIELNQQITRVQPIEDHLFSVTDGGELHVWNDQFSVWQPAIDSETRGSARTFGPIHDAEHNTVLVKSFFRNPFGDLQARSRKLSLIQLGGSRSSAPASSGDTLPADTPFSADAKTEDVADAEDTADTSDPTADPPQPATVEEEAAPEAVPTDPSALPNPFDSTSKASAPSGAGEGGPLLATLVNFSPHMVRPATTQDNDASSDEGRVQDGKSEQVDSLAAARKEPRWIPEPGPDLPQQLYDVLEMEDGIIAISRTGLFRMTFDRIQRLDAMPDKLFGINLGWVTGSAFEDVTPSGYFTSNNTTASTMADKSGIVVLSSGTINALTLRGKKFEVVATANLSELGLEGDGTEASLVQMNADYCVIARDGLPLALLTQDLQLKSAVALPDGKKVRQMSWIPATNLLSIVVHTGEFYQLDCEAGTITMVPVPYQGQVTCAEWMDGQRVWLGVEPNRAYLVNISTGAIEQACSPKQTTFQVIYYWFINPLYLINPKPAGLDNAMSYLLTGDQTATTQLITNDLGAAQVELQIWQPIVSNLAFLAFVLGVSCVYVARREF